VGLAILGCFSSHSLTMALLVGFEVVGDQVDETLRDGPLYLLQQSQVAFGVS
jgi:hypothetical protein